MFADFRPLRKVFGATLSKTIYSSGTKQDPIKSQNLTKDRLDPEPGRTSRACGIRLSQNKENNALYTAVNRNARIFAKFGKQPKQTSSQGS